MCPGGTSSGKVRGGIRADSAGGWAQHGTRRRWVPGGRSTIRRVSDLNLLAQSSCSCGEHDEAVPELDARAIPHAIRHAAILGVVDSLRTGAGFVLVAPHDPQPLLTRIQDRHGSGITVEYLQRGPQAWRMKLSRS